MLQKNKKTLFFALLAAGALLMLVGRFLTTGDRNVPQGADFPVPMAYTSPAPADSDLRATEERLEAFFSLMQGAGQVRVMLGFSTVRETVFAIDSTASEAFTREEDAQGGHRETRQHNEARHTVLVSDRNGGSQPLVLRESMPAIEGIVIITQGGEDPLVRTDLTRAAQAVLGIDAHRIQILTMKRQ
ncbi:MAG: hypothetical protein FWB88_03935 [Defluviitaleaceae bacterium]|nr:hypothetical protein [Defluviitaleaceae bacterium]MCL2239031.1 hypothetical protein [Defluviitaleaceae bacterium]